MNRQIARTPILFLLCCLVTGLCACKKPTPPPEPPPEFLPLLEPAYPDIPDVEHRDISPPPSPSLLRWNFSERRLHSYHVRQELLSTLVAHVCGSRDTRQILSRSDGFADFKGVGNATGKLEYKLSLREHRVNDQPQDVNAHAPTLLTTQVEDLGELFNVQILRGDADTSLLALLFTLPNRPLSVGEPFERPIDLPAQGEHPAQHGKARTVLTGYAQVGRMDCARLVTEADVELSLSPPTTGRGRGRTRIVSYFSLTDGRFIRIDAAIATSVRTRTHVTSSTGSASWTLGALDSLLRFTAELGGS